MTPASKAEYFAVALVLNLFLFVVTFRIFDLELQIAEKTASYNAAELPLMAFSFAGYAAVIIINSMRRIKQLKIGNTIAYATALPVVGQIVQIALASATPDNKSSYTPYGDNPYDPNSWVPNAKSSGKSGAAVAFRGEALMLPGEDHWDDVA